MLCVCDGLKIEDSDLSVKEKEDHVFKYMIETGNRQLLTETGFHLQNRKWKFENGFMRNDMVPVETLWM